MAEFNSTFVEELPGVGNQCPKCEQGYLEQADFTSKKGQKWEQVKCDKCKFGWIKSQKTNFKKATVEIDLLLDEIKHVNERLEKIWNKLIE